MRTRLFERDDEYGITRLWHGDGETFTIETIYDAEALVEQNKAITNAKEGNWKGEMHHVASIPLNVFWDLKRQGIVDDPAAFKKWLNDRDNRFFRTKEGSV